MSVAFAAGSGEDIQAKENLLRRYSIIYDNFIDTDLIKISLLSYNQTISGLGLYTSVNEIIELCFDLKRLSCFSEKAKLDSIRLHSEWVNLYVARLSCTNVPLS